MLVSLGIIEGKPDGSYGPTENVDRAQMAKMLRHHEQGRGQQRSVPERQLRPGGREHQLGQGSHQLLLHHRHHRRPRQRQFDPPPP